MVTLDQGGAGKAFLTIRASSGAAGSLAEHSWVQGSTPAPVDESWRIVPDPSPHLIHCRSRDGLARTHFVGARSTFVDVAHRRRDFTVGVRLLPGVLPLLLGVHAWELRERSVAVEDAVGRRGRELSDLLSIVREIGD